MYGATPPAAGGASLAATGLAAGSWVLLALGVLFIALGAWALVRKQSKHRP